jgi:uncharacterized ferritin-like protein (DUF455 family)
VELSTFALRVVTTPDLAVKLAPPEAPLTDEAPGPPRRLDAPARPPGLEIRPGREVKVPPLEGMGDPHQRARILHALANHELQAAELFAWALLAFADAPADFRAGLARILDDEQRHTRMYIARIEACGQRFGDFPVSGYFWNKVDEIRTPLHFVSAMSLTFENANLDHTVDTAAAARDAGDEKTARVIEAIGRDEEDHVRFGWTWLQRFQAPDADPWETWTAHLAWPLRPIRARGKTFNIEGRRRAGLDEAFIERLRRAEPEEGTRGRE